MSSLTTEVLLLALASSVRPTSLAAVYALLSQDSPRRLLALYLVASLAFTIAVGLIVIFAFQGIEIHSGKEPTKGIAEILGGVVMLGFGMYVLTRHAGSQIDDQPRAPGRWAALRARRFTPRTAALAGPATHIPGIFYLVALNLIVAGQPDWPSGTLEVVLYNVVWFALPILALSISIVRPAAARDVIVAVETWTKRNARLLMLIASFSIGGIMLVHGLVIV